MKTAISIWNNRIAPVFDSAKTFIIFEQNEEEQTACNMTSISLNCSQSVTHLLKENGVTRLVCGAVSRESEGQLIDNGIELFSFVAGSVDEVIDAMTRGILEEQRFSMPGCPCPRRRCARRRHHGNK